MTTQPSVRDQAAVLAPRRPNERLRPYVRDYQGYSQTGHTARTELPSGYVPLILGLGTPVRIVDPLGRAGPADYRTFVAGMHDSCTHTEMDGHSWGVQVNFTPIGAYLFLGESMDRLANSVVDLDDVFGVESRVLVEQLSDATSSDDRLSIVESFIASRMENARPASPAVVWAWQRIVESRGRVRVSALAGQLGWSRKHLNSRFREQIGLPAKTVARVARFNHALRLLDGGEGVSWPEIAYAAGYYDQSHLIRDVRQFAGATPIELMTQRAAQRR